MPARRGTAQPQTKLGRDVGLPQPTAHRWLELRATAKLLVRLPVCAVNRSERLADRAHLRTFRKEYGRKARAGILPYTGRSVEWLVPDVLAVPWWRVL